MHDFEYIVANAAEIEQKLGYQFQDKGLLALSFVHRSYFNEHREGSTGHNERLEFLGDSVLGMRSRLVDAHSCLAYISQLEITPFLLLGRGERMNDGRGRETILANLFEALIGAIYLDGGMEAARHFVLSHCSQMIDQIISGPPRNWKADLQDFTQKHYQQTPTYRVVSEMGPDHSKSFQISVIVNDKEIGAGSGSSKKEAQQAAAADALRHLEADNSGEG
jgi:ribonuclease-3